MSATTEVQPRGVIALCVDQQDKFVKQFTMALYDTDPIPEVVKIKNAVFVRVPDRSASGGPRVVFDVATGNVVATYKRAFLYELKERRVRRSVGRR